MIVIGGFGGFLDLFYSDYVDSIEVYKDNFWRTVSEKLPVTYGLKATTFNNRPLVFGMIYHVYGFFFQFEDYQVHGITPLVSEIKS